MLFLQSEKSWDSRADLIPSLYVFECVELELALKLASGEDEPFDSDFSCPIKLHRGKVFTEAVLLSHHMDTETITDVPVSLICSVAPAFTKLTVLLAF